VTQREAAKWTMFPDRNRDDNLATQLSANVAFIIFACGGGGGWWWVVSGGGCAMMKGKKRGGAKKGGRGNING